MKSYDDIVNQFDFVDDLPVPAEMLGAYIEGSLDPDEMDFVASVVESDDYLTEVVAEAATYDLEDYYHGEIFADSDEVYPVMTDEDFSDVAFDDPMGDMDDQADDDYPGSSFESPDPDSDSFYDDTF